MMIRTMAMAMMKMVDMAIIRAVARCPWPESSAGSGRGGEMLLKVPPPSHSTHTPRRPGHRNASRDHTWPKDLALKVCFGY